MDKVKQLTQLEFSFDEFDELPETKQFRNIDKEAYTLSFSDFSEEELNYYMGYIDYADFED